MESSRDVMILDDEPIVCERLQAALEKIGFDVETYTDSQEAIQRLAEKKYRVLVTDLKMRKPDGLEILQFVTRNCPDTRVIIITGFATVETATEALKSGAVDFIPKPFKISHICELIQRITAPPDGTAPPAAHTM